MLAPCNNIADIVISPHQVLGQQTSLLLFVVPCKD